MQEVIKIKSGKDLLKSYSKQEKPREVFGKYIHEGELCVLFGDSNAGKSILANDIAFFVSGGGHNWPDMVSPNMPSLYIDMEMTGKQFASRYGNAANYIPDGYSRAEVCMNTTDDKWSFIKTQIISMQGGKEAPKFIVIDNITNGFGSIFSAKRMLSLIAEMKTMKDRFGLTILLIAHCPKRNKAKPITQDSMGGSKMILNFVDSAFAVGTSVQDESVRYVKQIKTRESEKESLVMTLRIKGEPYLSFDYIDHTCEETHINQKTAMNLYFDIAPEKEVELVKLIMERLEKKEGERMSFYEIADRLGVPAMFVMNYYYENFVRQGYEK